MRPPGVSVKNEAMRREGSRSRLLPLLPAVPDSRACREVVFAR